MNSLYEKIISLDNLKASFSFIKGKNRRAGPDGYTWDFISCDKYYLNKLHLDLKSGTYMPSNDVIYCKPYSPRSDKILEYVNMNIREKIVEYAIKNIIYPLIDRELLDFCCAYRKGKGEKHVDELIELNRSIFLNNYISLDISAFFASIDRKRLLINLYKLLDDPDVVHLIDLCLWTSGQSTGLPIGHVLSPMLSNFYLSGVDQTLKSNNITTIRYGDNYIFAEFNRQSLEYDKRTLSTLLSEYRMTINESKTLYVYNPENHKVLCV